jgi:hypothetical protein
VAESAESPDEEEAAEYAHAEETAEAEETMEAAEAAGNELELACLASNLEAQCFLFAIEPGILNQWFDLVRLLLRS